MSIAMTNPARPDTGIDLNQVAHAEYRERLINEPVDGPIIDAKAWNRRDWRFFLISTAMIVSAFVFVTGGLPS